MARIASKERDGGRLIVCRSDKENVNHATVFALDARRQLQVLARINGGSEIEPLALALPPVS